MQVPASFQYRKATSIDEALALLARYGPESRVLAGGHSLLPMMKLRLAHPEALIDINECTEIAGIRIDEAGIGIGAMARHADVLASQAIGEQFPILHDAERVIADPIVRNRGTLVGSLCHADPQGDWASVVLALGGSIVAAGPGGRRTIPAAEFVTGPFENALDPDEIAVEAIIPAARGTAAGGYLKLERRVGDFATVGVAVAIEQAGGTVTRAGVALTGVGPNNIKAEAAETMLLGSRLDPPTINEAARLAAQAAQPRSDHRGSAGYKRQVVATFVARLLGARSADLSAATGEVAA